MLDIVEAGLVLQGSEVKSLRLGQVQLADAFARWSDGELWLEGVHIAPYQFANGVGAHDPDRRRKLLLHRDEIDRLQARIAQERLALVPLRLYFRDGRAKVELGLGQGPPEGRQAPGHRRARLASGRSSGRSAASARAWSKPAAHHALTPICQAGDVRKFVIMGVQGSGKGTQAELLADDLDLVHLSVGDIFRWHVQRHTKLGAQVRRIMAAGELVDDELVESVMRDRLAIHDWNYGFIVDGFPRNARQAEFFLESYDIDGVINLEMPDVVVHERVLSRRLCSGCGLDWNLLAHRPKVVDVCDICHSALVVREDDQPEALAVRLRDYHEKTEPVIELFQRKEFVASIDATASIAAIQAEIRRRFNLPAARQLTHRPSSGPPIGRCDTPCS